MTNQVKINKAPALIGLTEKQIYMPLWELFNYPSEQECLNEIHRRVAAGFYKNKNK